jgi:Gpi18-like mannosyltransferase
MPLQARAVPSLLVFVGFVRVWTGTAVPPQAWAVPSYLVNGFKFLSFFHIVFGQIPTKQIKITQNKQNKAIKSIGCLP